MSSKFTLATTAKIVARLRDGLSLVEACEGADVALATVKGWLTRGRRERSGLYAEFVASVEGARTAAADVPLTREEFERCLAASVRRGNIAAMRLWHEAHRNDGQMALDDPMDALERDDELARRRQVRGRPASEQG
jgi:hypothetical protein